MKGDYPCASGIIPCGQLLMPQPRCTWPKAPFKESLVCLQVFTELLCSARYCVKQDVTVPLELST